MSTGDDPRARALARIERRRGFQKTALGFAAVSALLVVIWAVSGAGFFWPVFPMLGMGIALAMQGYGTFARKDVSEQEIDREMAREQREG